MFLVSFFDCPSCWSNILQDMVCAKRNVKGFILSERVDCTPVYMHIVVFSLYSEINIHSRGTTDVTVVLKKSLSNSVSIDIASFDVI